VNIEQYELHIMPLIEDEGGGFAAVAPELPGCRSDGETPEEALRNGYDAIACWIEAAREMGRPVSDPRRFCGVRTTR
jgi:antitoxin HicB